MRNLKGKTRANVCTQTQKSFTKGEIVKKEKGITLIALVITIIILVILAGVSTALVIGNNGIMKKAEQASKETGIATAKDEVTLILNEYAMERDLENKELMAFLQEQKQNKRIEDVIDNEDDSVIIKINGYEVRVEKNNLEIVEAGEKATFNRAKTEGKIDIVFIDKNNNIINSPLEPVLLGNMKPIKLNTNGTDFEVTTKENWGYNYKDVSASGASVGQSIWANAQTTDGSMWVWIPRYAYKITYYDTDKTTILGYSNAQGIIDVKGNVISENPEGTQTVGEYIVHPAFTASAQNGGGFGQEDGKGISGLWVAKFETSGNEQTPSVKAGIQSLRMINVNTMYKIGKSAKFGETTDLKSHMMKNSEWGATVYLAHSQYGTNANKVERNKNGIITGGNSSKATIYTTNTEQSTTLNAYGVYDMVGTNWEYVASYVDNGNENLSTYGGSTAGDLYGATRQEQSTSTEYKTVYSSAVSDGSGAQVANYELSKYKKGDAIYETSKSHYNSSGSWFSALIEFPDGEFPFFLRGGVYSYADAGTFYVGSTIGDLLYAGSFRICLAAR